MQYTSLRRARWTLAEAFDYGTKARGTPPTRVRLDAEAARRLFFNALPEAAAVHVLQIEGRAELAAPLLRARSVVV